MLGRWVIYPIDPASQHIYIEDVGFLVLNTETRLWSNSSLWIIICCIHFKCGFFLNSCLFLLNQSADYIMDSIEEQTLNTVATVRTQFCTDILLGILS